MPTPQPPNSDRGAGIGADPTPGPTAPRPLLVGYTDQLGGAGIAMWRLGEALAKHHRPASFLVGKAKAPQAPGAPQQSGSPQHPGTPEQPAVHLPRSVRERLQQRLSPALTYGPVRALYRQRRGDLYSTADVPTTLLPRLNALPRSSFDLVHLHWLQAGFASYRDLAALAAYPTVWTLHDMWAFTGGCHFAGTCERYLTHCGPCPCLGTDTGAPGLARRQWQRKRRALEQLRPVLIAPSRWMAERARASSLLQGLEVVHIPNTIDTDTFRPATEPRAVRQALRLDPARQTLLYVAAAGTHDPRKGFDLLAGALDRLAASPAPPPIQLLVVGGDASSQSAPLPFPAVYLGHLSDTQQMISAYQAADLFICPSREDNLPNTVVEASACGLPTVAFRIGGMTDLILHQETGYLATPGDTADLAHGIATVLQQRATASASAASPSTTASAATDPLTAATRAHALRHFGMQTIADQHIALYRRVLAR